jgi:hypothetical protein
MNYTKEQIEQIIIEEANKVGVSPQAMLSIAHIESKLNPNAKNPRSSASGLFQFINSTGRQYGLKNAFDPRQNANAAARLMKDNERALTKTLGRKPNTGELYLAHQQGLGGARKILSRPNAKAANVVGNEAFRLNIPRGSNPNMTASEFANLWSKKASNTPYKDWGGNSSPALAFNNQSLPSPSEAPFPDVSSGLFQPANLFTAPRGQVQRESLPAPKPSSLPAAPSGEVIRAGSLPKAKPQEATNPTARKLQVAYQKNNVPTPVARPTDIPKPTYTPKASDYSNYMMNVKQPTLPTGSAIPTPAARPADLMPAPVIDGPVGKPLDLVPTPPTRIQQAKTKATNHLKEQLKPETLAARGAGALIGGLLGGPLGARAGSMFGPQIAQRLNNKQQGLFGGIFNQSNQAPMQTGAVMGSSSSEWGNAQNKGATYSASDGAAITGRGDGTYSRVNPITGGVSRWNSDGSRSTKGY